MRAKLTVESIVLTENCESIKFKAKYSDNKEDNTYSKYTPSAELSMNITNENLFGKIKPGMQFYVDFTEIK